MASPNQNDPTRTIRRLLRFVLLFSMLGVVGELVLLEHYDDFDQLIPMIAMGASVLTLAWDSFAPGRASRIFLRLAMVGLVTAAVAGLFKHYESNVEFQRELEPDLEGWGLVLETLKSGSPPALAPGVLALFGAIGWISTLGRPRGNNANKETPTS